MKKTLLILAVLLLSVPASAQRGRAKKTQKPVYTVTAQEAMAAYDFSLAEEILEHEIAELEKKKKPTAEQEQLLDIVHKSMLRLHATEQVTFIDSILLPKQQVLQEIKLSKECGTILRCVDFFDDAKNPDCTLYINELGNRVFYSEVNQAGQLRLKEKSLIGREWRTGDRQPQLPVPAHRWRHHVLRCRM